MLKNDKLKKPVGGSHKTGFSKILIKKVLLVFLLTSFLFSPLKINKINAQILETDEKTESLEFDKYDDLLEYTENTKTKEVIYNYKTNIVEQQTFNNLNENIDKRKEDVEFYINSNTRQEYAKIYSGKQYRKIENEWYKFETATTTENNFFMELQKTVPVENFFDKMISFFEFKETIAQTATRSIYSGSGDGRVRYYLSTNWDTTHDGTTGDLSDYTSNYAEIETGQVSATGKYLISRVFLIFDTSSIPLNSVIDSATLNVYTTVSDYPDNDSQAYIGLVSTTPSSFSFLINTDYDNCGLVDNPVLGAETILQSSFSISAYNVFNLNSTGISWINNNGYTYLGLREGHDIEDKVIALNARNYTTIRTSEYAGTDYDPYLWIEYTVEVPATTTADMYPCEIPENTLIQRFTGCENIYTTSTTTPNEIRFFYYDIPLILFLVFFIFSATPVIIILIFIYVRKKR